MNRSALHILLSGVSGLAACTGTDTGNPPVIDFGNSGCHDQRYGQSNAALQSLDKAVPAPLYKGLTCLAWQHVDPQTVRIDLTNYESGCASDQGWQPKAELREGGGLDLILQDKDCSTAGCFWCVYDLSFTVQLDQPPGDGEVRVYQQGCGEDAKREKRATLALASQSAGAVCNYAHSVALFERSGDAGGKRMPCGDHLGSQSPIACLPGNLCVDVGPRPPGDFSGGERCLPVCTTNTDCDTLTSCESGVCKLTTTGLISN
jgi:hypothetical protein